MNCRNVVAVPNFEGSINNVMIGFVMKISMQNYVLIREYLSNMVPPK